MGTRSTGTLLLVLLYRRGCIYRLVQDGAHHTQFKEHNTAITATTLRGWLRITPDEILQHTPPTTTTDVSTAIGFPVPVVAIIRISSILTPGAAASTTNDATTDSHNRRISGIGCGSTLM